MSNAESTLQYDLMANAIRALSMDAVQRANSGHPGMPMGMADVATVLFSEHLRFNPKDPNWADRDRFVLSAGHGSMLLYSLLYLTGYEDITLDEIKNFRQLGARTCGHPEFGEAGGIETTTGPLGQGLANAVGMALAERLLAARYGGDIVDHYTYVIAGDGCLMEGISHEAISMAGHLGLDKLIVLFDDNQISIDGPTDLSVSDDQPARFQASGWDVQSVDGHDAEAVSKAIAQAKTTNTPSLIACRTVIGKGAPNKAGTAGSHGAPLGEDEIEGARKALNWPHAPFEIPSDVLEMWRDVGAKGAALQEEWQGKFEKKKDALQAEFTAAMRGEIDEAALDEAISKLKQDLFDEPVKEATRKSSGNTLERLVDAVPALIGGSADLTGSNLTKTKQLEPIGRDDFKGRYVYYGVREHGMCAAMNGMTLHGGVVPYGGTFFVFTDYCRPSIRLAALMKQRVIYVMTHDSIGLGEDGPTHQPVEHLASLRAMPNLQIFRPCDAVETAEAWQLALKKQDGPSMLVLTRQGVPQLREGNADENISAQGAYVLEAQSDDGADVLLIGTGSEVSLCVEAAEALRKGNVKVRVVSMPNVELFLSQPKAYQQEVLGNAKVKLACEAACKLGWERVIGEDGLFVGMDSFGGSAPAGELYKHFGITSEAIVNAVKEQL